MCQGTLTTFYCKGELTCTNCGVVAESNMLDQEAEWRDFGAETSNTGAGGDRNRIGGPSDPLGNGSISANLMGGGKMTTLARKVMESHNEKNDGDRVSRYIYEITILLSLNSSIADKARTIYFD